MRRIPDIGTKGISACGLALVIGIPFGGAHAADAYRTIHRFEGGAHDGGDPSTGLIADSMGNLYGTTYLGGGTGCGGNGCGIIFKLTPSGGKWIETASHPLAKMVERREHALWADSIDGTRDVRIPRTRRPPS